MSDDTVSVRLSPALLKRAATEGKSPAELVEELLAMALRSIGR